ncbi:Undecaprenyl-phosphate mannosyltransferase [Planctomycetes bacterium Pan216]|uniref:Undecaprenyl-phosphate mannosyltransferase n=1 Tax=Kolteria novifilia TaxID=2527975 RepID=A0A518BBK8_9BACT|nr:Undecaprenyl-phosphate mannosyltransferase [Planctomycetes bacterium Pan216]
MILHLDELGFQSAQRDKEANLSLANPTIAVIIPTYREAANLPVLVPRIDTALRGSDLRGEIIVVDDNSPDDTERVCGELAKTVPLRLAIRRNERGLSSAVIHGMRMTDADVLLVMDADLSHPPEKIPELIETLCRPGVDFVIGSRYVAGGSTDVGWGLFRWLNSKAATLLARPLTNARDPMAGFFAIRRSTFRSAENLSPIGYKIGLELIVKCRCQQVREVGISFANRLHGDSKLTMKEQLNYVRHLMRLYGHAARRAFRRR